MALPVSSTVLVVAPDADLRQSLAFMLTAEGYGVATCDAWPPQDAQLAFDAVVIDHSALDRKTSDPRLAGLRRRAVVLASHPDTAQFATATLVRKPLLDRSLLDALSQALAT
ncbi:hypothetical protein ABAC460_07415 [Asticcacaulis sp. AC460]|uniref:hypothetical protein n=1 Tax=Asticcacaulis sp. AC460 TaxID=1282360 RepID=UPI0003C3FCCC|nr:hypothetical protein [Asticcacaulis sp. AC460]ESQ91052.1 hypothetical protein ABAC460_07415 [Asticcacaulis sp. AC460]